MKQTSPTAEPVAPKPTPSKNVPSANITCSPSTLSAVVPQATECAPQALLAIMPPTVARLAEDEAGARELLAYIARARGGPRIDLVG